MASLRSLIARFAADRRGNIAIMFGVMLVALVLAAGLAVDLQRMGAAKGRMQEAGDAAVLAAARYKSLHPGATDAQLSAIGRRLFNEQMKGFSEVAVNKFEIKFNSGQGVFDLNVNARLNTLLMRAAGANAVALNSASQVRLGKPPYLEIALALDVTGSMNQKGKLGDMKDAARDFVKSVFSHPDADVKVGVVPFAQYANVGKTYAGSAWLTDGGASWMGCVGSRNYPRNIEDGEYDLEKVPALSGAPCPDPLRPLSTDPDELDDMINDLDANGWTYIPAGLSWAWTLVSPQAPFAEGVSFADLSARNGYKTIVLMTDGENTRAPDYPTHNSTSKVLGDDLTKELCVNIKKQDIVVYTIAFDVTDTTIKSILEECATTKQHFFDAANADDMVAAFEAIASSLRSISLSR